MGPKTLFQVITLFPDLFQSLSQHGLMGQGLKAQRFEIQTINPREFTTDFHRTVDDRPYGGGDGMILMAEPLSQAVEKAIRTDTSKPSRVIYLSPQGVCFNDKKARQMAEQTSINNFIFICGRYGGIDQRVINSYVDEEISIGDYILTGGELAALVVIDSLIRFLPEVLGNVDSPHCETFSDGRLEGPSFTRPQTLLDQTVPLILLSGDHKKITNWRQKISLLLTALRRPDLVFLSPEQLQKEAHGLNAMDLKTCGFSDEEIRALNL